MLEEVFVTCPACWEEIALDIDLSAGDAEYTEDCPVCCRPMAVRVRIDPEDLSCRVEVAPESD